MFWPTFLAVLSVTALTGMALGAALGLTGLVILQFVAGNAAGLAINTVWNTLNSFTLTAIPLFIFMGEILMASGISRRAYTAIAPMFDRVPGSLLHTNIAVSAAFSAVSGSSISTAAAVGSVAYPEMKARGYEPRQVIGSIAAGGTLGLLIPPSLSLLIYGALTETSIGQLFAAGLVPGVLMAVLFMAFIYLRVRLRGAPTETEGEHHPFGRALVMLLSLWPLVLLFFAVMGSIFFGLATPTEAAAVGVVASVLIGFFAGDLTLTRLYRALLASVVTFTSIGFIFVGALILGQSVAILGIAREMVEGVSAAGFHPYLLFAVIALLYLALGCVFDGLSIMIMTLPVVFPLLTGLGFDPIWLGVIITIMVEIGLITPPVGLNLYVLTAIAGRDVSISGAARGAIPYWAIMLVMVALLTAIPGIALWLPTLLFR
ncbi:MAG: TRAP transporter large permease [Pseudomonadota bacterium]